MHTITDWAATNGWSTVEKPERRQAEMRIGYLNGQQLMFETSRCERFSDELWIVGEIDLDGSSVSSNRLSPSVRHAIVFAELPDNPLPRFRLQSKLNHSGGVFGVSRSDDDSVIEDDPEFQRKFRVVTDHRDLVRDCLNRTIRDRMLQSGAAIELLVRPRHLLLMVAAESLVAMGPQDYVDMAREIAAQLTQNRLNSLHRDDPGPSREERLQLASSLSGIPQRKLLQGVFDEQDIREFAARAVPREIPDYIWRPFAGDRFLFVFCMAFGCVMLCAAGVLGFLIEERPTRLLFSLGACLLAVIFFSVFVLLRIFEARKREILRNGKTVAAKIQRVDETPWINGNCVYKATIQLDDSCQIVTQHVQGLAAGHMMDLAGSDKGALVLQDPQSPKRVLVIEAIVI